ncbi:hypothetical protein [Streptomyces sp. NPDC055400]
MSTYAEALDGADIAAATTHSLEPVIRRPWLEPGHITSVGYNPAGREVDDATVAQALVCVEVKTTDLSVDMLITQLGITMPMAGGALA